MFVFVGTYSRRGSAGIYTFRLASDDGRLDLLSTAPADNASFLALSPDLRTLYAANEGPDGAASAYRVDPSTGALTQLNRQPTLGSAPCHVEVDPSGRWLLVAHYGDGTHASLPIQPDGSLGPVARKVANAGTPGPGQQGGHGHSTTAHPVGGTALACDLGLDRVIVYRIDPATGDLVETGGVDLPPGAGPRHLSLHPALPLAYVICERDSTVAVVNLLTREIAQIEKTIPADFTEHNACADVHLGNDARYLYGSNRGHDSLVTFAVDTDGGLRRLGWTPSGGKEPRNFAVLPGGLILVANQESDNIVALRAADALPAPTGAVTTVPAPVCVIASPEC